MTIEIPLIDLEQWFEGTPDERAALARQVDAHLRRPPIHDVFGIPQEPGFTDLLLGAEAGGRCIRNVVRDRVDAPLHRDLAGERDVKA